MFITNNRGYGLLEVLMAGAIGAIMMAGTMKGVSLSVQNSQVVQATLDEAEFRKIFKQKVAEDNVCKNSLVFQNQESTGTVPHLANSANSEDDKDKLTIGRWRSTSIDIVKFDFQATVPQAEETQSQSRRRKLFAYYKKDGLGELSTVGGKDCASGNIEGCYVATCSFDYKTFAQNADGDYPVESCEVKACSISLSLDDDPEGCGPGAYLRGWDDGVPDCVSLAGLTADANPCPYGTIFKGYEEGKSPPKAICTRVRSCPAGETLSANGECVNFTMEFEGAPSMTNLIAYFTPVMPGQGCEDFGRIPETQTDAIKIYTQIDLSIDFYPPEECIGQTNCAQHWNKLRPNVQNHIKDVLRQRHDKNTNDIKKMVLNFCSLSYEGNKLCRSGKVAFREIRIGTQRNPSIQPGNNGYDNFELNEIPQGVSEVPVEMTKKYYRETGLVTCKIKFY